LPQRAAPPRSSRVATSVLARLSLHDALPILAHDDVEVSAQHAGLTGAGALPDRSRGLAGHLHGQVLQDGFVRVDAQCRLRPLLGDRKSTRLNSSHVSISYAVFCLKKKSRNTV